MTFFLFACFQISSDSGVKSDMMSNGHGGSSLSAREEAQMRTAQRCKNYDCYVEWFNRLSFLVASTVCRVNYT